MVSNGANIADSSHSKCVMSFPVFTISGIIATAADSMAD